MVDLIQFVQQIRLCSVDAVKHLRAQTNLWQGRTGELDGNRNRRHEKRGDEHPVLSDLRPRNALHATERGVDKDDGHTDEHADRQGHLKKAGEHHADAFHLADDVGKRNENRKCG